MKQKTAIAYPQEKNPKENPRQLFAKDKGRGVLFSYYTKIKPLHQHKLYDML